MVIIIMVIVVVVISIMVVIIIIIVLLMIGYLQTGALLRSRLRPLSGFLHFSQLS